MEEFSIDLNFNSKVFSASGPHFICSVESLLV